MPTFWKYDWPETLENHRDKPVRRIFIFRRRSEIETYKLILRKHAKTYGAEGVLITSEKVLKDIQEMLGYTLDPGMDFGLFDNRVLSRLYADKAIITSIDTPAQYQQEREFEGFQKIFKKLVLRSIPYAQFCNSKLDIDESQMDKLFTEENINFDP